MEIVKNKSIKYQLPTVSLQVYLLGLMCLLSCECRILKSYHSRVNLMQNTDNVSELLKLSVCWHCVAVTLAFIIMLSRLSFSTAFSTNAVSICHSAGLTSVKRVEQSVRYLVHFNSSVTCSDESVVQVFCYVLDCKFLITFSFTGFRFTHKFDYLLWHKSVVVLCKLYHDHFHPVLNAHCIIYITH